VRRVTQIAEVSKSRWDDSGGAFGDLLLYDAAEGSLSVTDLIDTGRSEALQGIASRRGLPIRSVNEEIEARAQLIRKIAGSRSMEAPAYARCVNAYRAMCEKGQGINAWKSGPDGSRRGAPVEADNYTEACRAAFRALSGLFGRDRIDAYSNRYASKDLVASIGFAGMEIKPSEAFSLAFVASLSSLAAVAVAGIAAAALGSLDTAMAVVLVLCGGTIPTLAYVYVGEYPKRRAAYMKVHSLGDVPEVVSYIVMAMKLSPNIELALKFAASNSKRQLAKDVKKLMWGLQARAYDSLDAALGAFAEEWGGYSEHFKRAIFLIKSAADERDEAMRTITLNRALDVVLAGTKGLMQSFSTALHSPTLILYSIFVMVPLALVAMLPAVAIVGLRVNSLELALLYDGLFPMATLVYAHSILMKRPAAFTPPDIPAIKRGLPRWAWAIIACAGGAAAASPFFAPAGLPVTGSIFLAWGVTAAISIYCLGVYTPYKK